MGFLAGYGNDIFISYHHGDNLSLDREEEGWVSQLDQRLRVRLRQLLGVEPAVWRDRRLGGADAFSDEIGDQLRRSAVLVPVLSPGYFQSQWCRKEREEFQRAAAQSGGFQVANVLRGVKVIKTPLDGDRHRDLWPESLGCPFYEREADSQYFREFEPGGDEFDRTLDRLAQEIKRVLQILQSSPSRLAVFVSEVTPDLKPDREKLRQELVDRGYRVLPEAPMAPDADAVSIDEAIAGAVDPCVLAVHLMGPRHGFVPDGGEHSIVVMQYEAARAADKPRIVAVRETGQEWNRQQQEFVQSIRNSPTGNLDLLENRNLEQIKDVVLDHLRRREAETAKPAPAPEPGAKTQLYLVCDPEDHPLAGAGPSQQQALALKDWLARQGFAVWLPLADETDSRRLRKDHKDTLKMCDAVMLYWGRAGHDWFREKLRELVQARGWRASKPFAAKALYIASPEGPERTAYQGHEEFVFFQFGGFAPEPLSPLVQKLSKGAGASG